MSYEEFKNTIAQVLVNQKEMNLKAENIKVHSKVWTLHESYTKDHFAPFGARPSSFQKNHQFP